MTQAKETAHITAVKKQWDLKTLAAKRPHFKIVNGKSTPYMINAPTGDLDSLLAAENHTQEEALQNVSPFQAGQMVEGHGVYLGLWQPEDREGRSLGKIFNIFAAPLDLTDDTNEKVQLTFDEAVQHMAQLKNWNGHDGGNFENDTALYTALTNGSYKGEWFIPTRDLLTGINLNGIYVQTANLCHHKDRGSFKDTFNGRTGDLASRWYWSCTENPDNPKAAYSAQFWDGREEPNSDKSGFRLLTRPVRAELQSPV